jgi:hypothetical protein
MLLMSSEAGERGAAASLPETVPRRAARPRTSAGTLAHRICRHTLLNAMCHRHRNRMKTAGPAALDLANG